MNEPAQPSGPGPRPTDTPVWSGVLAGLLGGLVAVAVGAAVAGAIHRVSPVDGVGQTVIDNTPAGVKHWAIQVFGHHDKDALRVGIAVLLAAAAAAIGAGTRRRVLVAVLGVAAFGVVGAWASESRPGQSVSAVWPSVVGAVAALAALVLLLRPDLVGPRRADAGATSSPGSTDPWAEPGDGPVPAPTVVRSSPRRSLADGRFDRRRFLEGGVVTLGVAAVGAGIARSLDHQATTEAVQSAPVVLPPPVDRVAIPAGAQLDAATPYVTGAADFYRIDTAFSYPRVRADRWHLDIGGMVDHPLRLSYDDLLQRPQVERAVTLCCVSNEIGGDLVGNAVWQGVLLRDLLHDAAPQAGAQQVASESVDGFTAGFPIDIGLDPGRDCLVALGMNGSPLPLAHGFPARLVVPGLYGYVSATKWLSRIQLTTWDGFDGYWVGEGWSKLGPVKTASRIDVPRGGRSVKAGRTAVAGVAWAQHRGISKVEVQVDDGPWHEATLGAVVGPDTWRQWSWAWDAAPGKHVLRVRATDGTGATQTRTQAPPAPDGATGWHERTVKVVSA